MRIDTDAELVELIRRTKTVAVLGVSHKPARPSHKVFGFWQDMGVEAIPVNPGLAGQRLLGCDVVGSLAALGRPVDMVDVFRDPQFLPQIVEDVIACGASCMWTQLGVRHAAAEGQALAQGLDIVIDRCPAQEVPRLRALGYTI